MAAPDTANAGMASHTDRSGLLTTDIAADPAAWTSRVFASLTRTTRLANRISAEDLTFHRSLDPDVGRAIDGQALRLLRLVGRLIAGADVGLGADADAGRTESAAARLGQEGDDVEGESGVAALDEQWDTIVDVIDGLLERADSSVDEYTGRVRRSPQDTDGGGMGGGKPGQRQAPFPTAYGRGNNIPKPQLEFDRAPDNWDESPFRPLLRSKPHAKLPLEDSLKKLEDNSYAHPYEKEIELYDYPERVYYPGPAQHFLPFESATATFVDSLDGVHTMLGELEQAKEIAVDLEHNDTHSYHGLVCLMQISTRDKDWIVDTLKPWREELQVLNKVFADPSIIKVFHGASMDVVWLQRDLGLYLVGLFDTYHAACALGYPKRSLKYLLEQFAGVSAAKQYQRADWRLRPLLPGMFDYARSDTHYLLYIYDRLRHELAAASTPDAHLATAVLTASKQEALRRYDRVPYDAATGTGPGGWLDLVLRPGPTATVAAAGGTEGSPLLSRAQLAALRAVHGWRDRTARAEDLGVSHVLARHALLRIAMAMPADAVSMLRAAAPVSPIVRARVLELVDVVQEAAAEGSKNGPDVAEVLVTTGRTMPEVAAAARETITTEETAATTLGASVPETAMGLMPDVGRADTSQFWGACLPDMLVSTASPFAVEAAEQALHMTLPLPGAVAVSEAVIEPAETDGDVKMEADEDAEVDADNVNAGVEEEQSDPASGPPPQSKRSAESDEAVFSLRQLGATKKRRVERRSDTDGSANDQGTIEQQKPDLPEEAPETIALDNPETLRADRHASRRERKRARRSAAGDKSQGAVANNNQLLHRSGSSVGGPAFDYSTAQPVLNAPPQAPADAGNGKGYNNGSGKRPAFNPQVSLTAVPRGLGRLRRETAARAKTFTG